MTELKATAGQEEFEQLLTVGSRSEGHSLAGCFGLQPSAMVAAVVPTRTLTQRHCVKKLYPKAILRTPPFPFLDTITRPSYFNCSERKEEDLGKGGRA